jgi:phage major head subunit gpT-like protein
MPISGNVPQHLVVGARTGFLTGLKALDLPYKRIAGVVDSTARTLDLTDMGAIPMPTEGTPVVQDMAERALSVKARDWSTVVKVSYNVLRYDQTGQIDSKARGAGERFQTHINGLVFKALDAGDGTTYGACYDGLSFFNDSHVDKAASYTTAQDNNFALALSGPNFNTNYNLATQFRDDKGEFVEHTYDLLVVSPALRYEAAQITGNAEDYTTANRALNPYSGMLQYIVSPNMNSTAWAILATSETQKPLYVGMWEQPALQDAWFDPLASDGGMYYFKFFASYNIFYGDWRLAALGNT